MSYNTIKIPGKSLFKIDEVCGLIGVKPYVLRFWEDEFDEISPIISSAGRKLYEHKDIEAISLVKKLLFEDKMPIEEAKTEIKLRLSSSQNEASEDKTDGIVLALEDETLAKLAMAKKNLSNLISMTDSLKQKHNWS